MAKQSKQSAMSDFPVYFKITTISVLLASFYAMFLVAMEIFVAK